MKGLHQPFRAILGLTEVLARFKIGPTREKLLASPAAVRQLQKPPFWMTRPGDPTIRTYDAEVGGRGGPIRVRLYVSPTTRPGSPAFLYVHGGGFVAGGLDGADYITRGLAARTGFPVVSVEYRLSPECPFPGPLEDCEDALIWLAQTCPEGIDPTRIAVGGDSAGGNLAAALSLLVRDRGGPAISHQTLIYPFTDGTLTAQSWHTYAAGGVDLAAGKDMMRYYAPNHPADDPLVSPLHASSLAGLPPSLVITAEFDVLHDDGRRYAERLRAAEVPVVHRNFLGVPHGFVTMPRLCRESDQALDLVAAEVMATFSEPQLT